ncbi:MAG: response regulator [Lachnospiraceae bacterium]|nr:response regulator [Lachnospiraceae bacterium]
MNLLIIDDEYFIVQGLVEMIDRESLGIDKIFTAYSAKNGRQILQREQVDLLLIDVEMPQETGLELLEKLRLDGISVTTIILSGHQRFDYAQEAIRYHCFNYLLKPIGKQSLNYELSRAVEFIRSKQEIPKCGPEGDMKPKESEFITSVRRYILDHLSDPDLNRVEIAEAMHLNPDYLSYSFHKEFGNTLTAYITSVRMDHAKYLLKNTTLPIHQIAEEVGIPNLSYFYRQFKKAVGTTPQLFRG